MTTYENELRSGLELHTTAKLMQGVRGALRMYSEFLTAAEQALDEGDISEARVIRDNTADEIAALMDIAVVMQDVAEGRGDIHQAAKSLGLNTDKWAPSAATYEAGLEYVLDKIEDAIAAAEAEADHS